MNQSFHSNTTESLNRRICYGCLCNDRKITLQNDALKKQCFFQIIWEISGSPTTELPVHLCWECEAYIRRFIRFKSQVQKSYKLLSDVTREPINPQPKLQIFKPYNISILPSEDESEIPQCKVIKSENINISPDTVKEELVEENDGEENNSEEYSQYSDEDIVVLKDIATVKRKVRNRKGRQRKKEKKSPIEIKHETEIYTEIELSAKEIDEERKEMQEREDFINALFRCERCILSFPNADDLNDHVRSKHDLHASSKYKCKICSCAFASEVSYNYHSSKHSRRFGCAVCALKFTSKRAVTKHYQTTHCLRDYDFDKSNENEKTDSKLENSINETAALFSCSVCEKAFKWKTSLRKHAETHRIESGQKRRPYCEPCRLSFTSTSTLQNHVKTSSKHQIQLKLRKLQDTLPDSMPPEKEQAHIEEIKTSINNTRQLYPCSQCDKKFQWKGNLLRHLQSHAARANGELVCKPCNRTFSSIATYKQHMKISKKHVSENDFNYMCSECGKRFANKTRLKDHIDWEHLKNYVHKCPTCQKVFKTHTSLYLHKQVVHKNGAEHLCDHCGKPFPNRTKLRSHILALHTSGAAYTCSQCGARFNWHSCLSRHMRRLHKGAGDKGG